MVIKTYFLSAWDTPLHTRLVYMPCSKAIQPWKGVTPPKFFTCVKLLQDLNLFPKPNSTTIRPQLPSVVMLLTSWQWRDFTSKFCFVGLYKPRSELPLFWSLTKWWSTATVWKTNKLTVEETSQCCSLFCNRNVSASGSGSFRTCMKWNVDDIWGFGGIWRCGIQQRFWKQLLYSWRNNSALLIVLNWECLHSGSGSLGHAWNVDEFGGFRVFEGVVRTEIDKQKHENWVFLFVLHSPIYGALCSKINVCPTGSCSWGHAWT